MFARRALEPLARRVWRERWNAIAHAELRRNFSWRNIAGIAFLQLLCLAIIALSWWRQDLAAASATARIVVGVSCFVAIAMCAGPANSMFRIDNSMQVTEAWLLTSEPREDILGSRLAGTSLPGPLLVVALAPVYYIAALGLPAGAGPLFTCGHVARFGTCYELAVPPAAAFVAAVPAAVMAMLADVIAPPAYAAITLPSSLYQTATRRSGCVPFAGLLGILRYGRLFLASVSVSVLALLAELALSAGAGFWAWGMNVWKLPDMPAAGLDLVVSALCVALLVGLRRSLARAGLRIAGRHYDHTLITDEPQ